MGVISVCVWLVGVISVCVCVWLVGVISVFVCVASGCDQCVWG